MALVTFYGEAAECVGAQQLDWKEASITAKELLERLVTEYPKLADIQVKVAINDELSLLDATISPTDQVSILPPFAGG